MQQQKQVLLFRIPITIDFIQTQPLLDTGSSQSICSLAIFNQISAKNKSKEFGEEKITFKSASGQTMQSIGKYDITFKIQDKHQYIWSFHVFKNTLFKKFTVFWN